MTATARPPPTIWAATKPGTDAGAIPAKEAENIRPTVMAGLAKLVEDVKKYPAPIYAPTAAGTARLRPDLASAKMTRTRPRVATTSDRKCAGELRPWADRLSAARANIRFASTAPPTHPATCAGRYAAASRHR